MSGNGQHSHGSHAGRELGFAITACALYVLGMVAEYALGNAGIATALFVGTYLFGGWFTVQTAVATIRRGRFEVDFLMLVAAAGAATIGRWAEGAVLLALFSLGHALEEYAMGRAKRSIEALAELAPAVAIVRRDGEEREVPTEQVRIGDVVIVRPHARFPVDGAVIAGISAVDQSPITGESLPVEKQPMAAYSGGAVVPPESRVFAGTINGAGLLEVATTENAGDSTLARVVRLVAESESSRSRTQLFIDRFQRWYVPAVVGVVLAVLAIGLLLGDPFADAFSRAMVVLVAGSPCALAIATPAAVLAGVARAARAGLLVKGGGPLELIGRVRAIAFDKTGTLTWGQPVLADTVVLPGADRSRVERSAYALERASDHPLASAIVAGLRAAVAGEPPVAERVESVTGRGVRGEVDGSSVLVGSERFFSESGVPVTDELRAAIASLHERGMTVMAVAIDGRPQGVLGVRDVPRGEARAVLAMLRGQGVDEMLMISGDHQRVAEAVGAEVGVDRALGGLMPDDKVTEVERLGADGRVTAMLGDGVNDAPAMTRASVGIAMGAAGSAVALETADVAIMSDDIGRIPYLLRLSRATARIVRQNLVLSLAIVAVLVPLSAFDLAEMGPVVLLHEGSTLLVVGNALRLLRYGKDREHDGIAHETAPGEAGVRAG